MDRSAPSLIILGQVVLERAAGEPYVPDDHQLDYVPACVACGGIETVRSLAVLRCADCGAVIR